MPALTRSERKQPGQIRACATVDGEYEEKVPGASKSVAFLQINKLFLSRHVDVLDALLRNTHDASTERSNPDYLGLVLAHVDFSASHRR